MGPHGFYVVELPDLANTVELAGLLPEMCTYTVEVRPTLHAYGHAGDALSAS